MSGADGRAQTSSTPGSVFTGDFLEAILDHVAHPIFVKDRAFRFVLLNKALEAMIGVPRAAMVGRTDYDFFSAAEADFFRARDQEVFDRAEPVSVEEETLTDASGVRHVLATTKVPMRSADGAITHLVGIIHDITALKRAEDALRVANDTLEQRVRERTAALETAQTELMRRERLAVVGQLAGALAHQVRNPLGSIKNAAYLLKLATRTELDPDAAHALAIIHDEVKRANQIITDLLDFARIRPPTPRDVPAAYVLDHALGGVALGEHVTLRRDIDEDVVIRCDREQVQTAVFNLLRSACDGMTEGGVLSVCARPDGDGCVIEVADTGAGLAHDLLEQLRDPLAIQDRRITLGLHLMTARALIENQGGTFAVSSSPGAGTRYTLRVPRVA